MLYKVGAPLWYFPASAASIYYMHVKRIYDKSTTYSIGCVVVLLCNESVNVNPGLILWWNAQSDKMPKYDKMAIDKMPKSHFVQVWQNAQGDEMPKRHYS